MIRVYYVETLGFYGLPNTTKKAIIIYNESAERAVKYEEIVEGITLNRDTLEELGEHFSKNVCDEKDFNKRWEAGKETLISNITKEDFAKLLSSFYYYEVLVTYENTET